MTYLKKICNIISTIVLIVLICFINVGTMLIINNDINYLAFSKYFFCFGILFLIIYLVYKIINKEEKISDIIVALLGVFSYISYIFAFNKEYALNGAFGRNEGLYAILTYYMIFLLASTLPKKNQKIVIYCLLISGIIQILIGTIQTMRLPIILGYNRSSNFSTHFKFASGTFGNPNFYSAYILMCLVYVYIKSLNTKNKLQFVLNSILTLIFGYGLIIGNTSSCILSFLIVLVYTLIKKINKQNIKKVVIILVIFLILLISGIKFMDQYFNNRVSFTMKKNVYEVVSIFSEGINDKTFNYRVFIWKNTLKYVPKYLFTGIGLDNFAFLNNGTYLCYSDQINRICFDKAHNEYLQILITQGIFSLVTYLVLLGLTIYLFYKKQKQNSVHYKALYFGFIAYLIQAFFNISVITVAPIFYMIMGFLNNEYFLEN